MLVDWQIPLKGANVGVDGQRPAIQFPYPPLNFFLEGATYVTLLQWALPTLLIPLCIGGLVSFRSDHSWNTPRYDPLTAAIIRTACVFAGDWGLNWTELGISPKWRILSASVATAFALAEAVGASRTVRTPTNEHAPDADDISETS